MASLFGTWRLQGRNPYHPLPTHICPSLNSYAMMYALWRALVLVSDNRRRGDDAY